MKEADTGNRRGTPGLREITAVVETAREGCWWSDDDDDAIDRGNQRFLYA